MQWVVGQNTHKHSCILQKATTCIRPRFSLAYIYWHTIFWDVLNNFLHTKQYGSAGTGCQKKSLVRSGAVWVAAGTITQKSEKNTALKCNVCHRADRKMSTKISNLFCFLFVAYECSCLTFFVVFYFSISVKSSQREACIVYNKFCLTETRRQWPKWKCLHWFCSNSKIIYHWTVYIDCTKNTPVFYS